MPPPKAKDGIPFITISNIDSNNHLDFSNTMYVSRDYWDSLDEKRKARKGDVLYSVTGSYGIPVYITDDKEFVFQRHIAILKPNTEIISGKYLYYLLKSPVTKALADKLVTGAIQKTLGLDVIRNMAFEVPSLEEQEEITSVLSAVDSKIDTNVALCSDLEAMAKLLYDYWFVQFDFPDENGKPYRSSGGKMVWNEVLKREIPKGWEVGYISDLGTVIGGATQSTKNNNYDVESGIGWITPNDLSITDNKFISHGERDITEEAVASCSTTIMPKGTVLMSSRAPIGYLAIASDSLCTNQGFKSIVPNGYGSEYIYQTLSVMMPYIKNFGVGSTFAEVSKEELSNMRIILPDHQIETAFAKKTNYMNEQIELLEEENHQLASLRDFLLPMLMNGQIKVSDVTC